jgi:SAM-dependent methyltransferase
MHDLEFRHDLYSGAAGDYDRFRVPYPKALTDDLAARSAATGAGTLLDLACGTGQITFALHDRFGEVWAVDQEPDMVRLVAEKITATGATNIRPLVSAAEQLSAPAGSFDLIAMGNAFHRLRRRSVAASAFDWLRPGGFLALLWGGGPLPGTGGWQQALSAAEDRWTARPGVAGRVPAEYESERAETPDAAILSDCGFAPAGRYTFLVDHEWTADTLIGHAYSTSVLSRAALGALAPDFEADVRRELAACDPGGRFRQVIDFDYDLFRKPAS